MSVRSRVRTLVVLGVAGLSFMLVVGAPAACESKVGDDLEQLGSWLSGSFSSAAQAEADEDFFDIRLEMHPIWKDRSDGLWLYVEQAVASSLDKPYRQRVYRLRQLDENLFESRVYSLPSPEEHVGAFRDEVPLAKLTPADLELRDGCAILMRKKGESFSGSTLGRLCTSTLRGATFATSEVTISPRRVLSWDRGFDDAGSQVWGAVKSGYVFDRQIGEPSTSEPTGDQPAPASDADASDAPAEEPAAEAG